MVASCEPVSHLEGLVILAALGPDSICEEHLASVVGRSLVG